jgi:hypothetical protein
VITRDPRDPISTRTKTIVDELNNAAKEFRDALEILKNAQVTVDMRRERLSALQRVASGMLTGDMWKWWQENNKRVRYVGMLIGPAIAEVLRGRAYESATRVSQGMVFPGTPPTFNASLSMDEIVQELDHGGFEFKTSYPMREVNAALMKLAGVKKRPDGRFEHADATNILNAVIGIADREASRNQGEE